MFRLEITMESRCGEKQKYIKRSFPAEKGTLEIGKYGYPFSKYGTIEIGNFIGITDGYLEFNFAGTNLKVFLNSFLTVKKEYATAHIDPYLKLPVPGEEEIVHTTFYLYIE
ncbi:MAG: hypothetical protein LBH16_01860 [Treponema sp.]|jgi:hypothetical protein|nr:hypothetical protein [Treponema sp.]